jgi:hypothetical protein
VLVPIGHLAIEHLPFQPASLPGREVRVLDGQLGERHGLTAGEGLVERPELALQHAHRPTVGDDVVHHQEQDVRRPVDGEEPRAEERALLEVEGTRGLRDDRAPRLAEALLFGQPRQRCHRKLDVGRLVHDLYGPAAFFAEGGPQRLVPASELGEGLGQGRLVDASAQLDRRRDVVRGVTRRELVEEPEPLLREGEGLFGSLGHLGELWQGKALSASERLFDALAEGGRRRSLEEAAQGELDAEGLAHPEDGLRREQRVPAEGEEVVVRADLLHGEHRRPDADQHLFHRGAGSALGRDGVDRVGARERAAIDLAVLGERQLLERDEGRRDHVLRELLAKEALELGG